MAKIARALIEEPLKTPFIEIYAAKPLRDLQDFAAFVFCVCRSGCSFPGFLTSYPHRFVFRLSCPKVLWGGCLLVVCSAIAQRVFDLVFSIALVQWAVCADCSEVNAQSLWDGAPGAIDFEALQAYASPPVFLRRQASDPPRASRGFAFAPSG